MKPYISQKFLHKVSTTNLGNDQLPLGNCGYKQQPFSAHCNITQLTSLTRKAQITKILLQYSA